MFIAGPYTATYAPAGSTSGGSVGTDIGRTREGFTESIEYHHQPIQTDAGGESQVDGVQLGVDHLVRLDYVDYDLVKAAIHAVEPEGKVYDNVGKLLTSLAGPLVLTPVAGTTAAASGGTHTFHKAIIENAEILFSSRLRQGPLTFRCFPDPTVSNKVKTVA
jgi:hypothetical protein